MCKITKNLDKIIQFPQYDKKTLDKTVTFIVQYLNKHNMKIATAESCTGGLLSSAITSVAGSSEVFEIGFCTYAAEMKTKYLGVNPETIAKYNVASREVAAEMAAGLHKVSGADICLTTTGVAGPSGGTPEIPVGTVFEGFYLDGEIYTLKLSLCAEKHLTRSEVRFNAVLDSFLTAEKLLSER